MTYHSLFDIIASNNQTFRDGFDRQSYLGTLDGVLNETEEALSYRNRGVHALDLALHPPRIIRAFIDYKVQDPSDEIETLLRDAIKLGLDIYNGEDNALEQLRELRRRTKGSGVRDVLQRTLKQPLDLITWRATRPSCSIKTAGDLASRTNGADVLFIALAHGGVAAGMDTYLRYCDEVNNSSSSFYVARFSAHKLGDLAPKLTLAEITYLQKQAIGRTPVIFDEDRASGSTLDTAEQFFTDNVFPFGNVIVLTNLDIREKLKALGCGNKLTDLDLFGLGNKEKHEIITEEYIKYLDSKMKNDSSIGEKPLKKCLNNLNPDSLLRSSKYQDREELGGISIKIGSSINRFTF